MLRVPYICDPFIIPALMPRDVTDLKARVNVIASIAPRAQLDVMDGRFTESRGWPFGPDGGGLNAFSEIPTIPGFELEAHLMVESPLEIGLRLIDAGVKRLIPHVESFNDQEDLLKTFDAWRHRGAVEIGLAFLLETPLGALEPVIRHVDIVQLMGIAKVGVQGQPFDERTLLRVEEIHATYSDLMVSVDGGVSEATVEQLVRAGANRLVVGSALFKENDPKRSYEQIHVRAMAGCAPLTTAGLTS